MFLLNGRIEKDVPQPYSAGHNSNRSIWGCNQRMESEKLYRVLLSRYFYSGLNGQLCPEYFQKGPRNLYAFLFSGKPLLRGCRSSLGPPPIHSGLVGWSDRSGRSSPAVGLVGAKTAHWSVWDQLTQMEYR